MAARRLFPPVNSGGLIEAITGLPTMLRPAPKFPPVNSGGLFEVSTAPAMSARRLSGVPPVNSGGLIRSAGGFWRPCHGRPVGGTGE